MAASSKSSADVPSLPAISPKLEREIGMLIVKLKRREVMGAYAVGKLVAKLFVDLVSSCPNSTAVDLMHLVRTVGWQIQNAQPLEFTIGCMTRRVLTFIRQGVVSVRQKQTSSEKSSSKEKEAEGVERHSSLSNLFHQDTEDFSLVQGSELRQHVTTELAELLDEIKGSYVFKRERERERNLFIIQNIYSFFFFQKRYQAIAEQAEQHIHTNEIVLTYGRSRTVCDFLTQVKFRKFEVIVAESTPSNWGRHMAKELSAAGISTTLITDSAVFAMMARVNIVIVGTHAVLANGGLIAHTGLGLIAAAAKHYSVPLVVCSGLYKLCPLYAFDQDTFQDHNSPAAVLPFSEADDPSGQVDVCNPSYDYIPPELVSLFVTNDSSHAPSYIYRQLAEFYHRDDYDLTAFPST